MLSPEEEEEWAGLDEGVSALFDRYQGTFGQYLSLIKKFVDYGEFGLALSDMIHILAQQRQRLSGAEANELAALVNVAADFGEPTMDRVLPFHELDVVDGAGERIAWTPPLASEETEHPKKGGGHGSGRRLRGRREFPWAWTSEQIAERVLDIAGHPQPGRVVGLPGGLFRAWDVREGVLCETVVDRTGRLLTAYPVSGPGVFQNAGRDSEPISDLSLDREERHLVNELGQVIDGHAPGLAEPVARSVQRLYDVGEWQLAVYLLRAALASAALDPEQRAQLERLATETGADDPTLISAPPSR